MSATHTPGPWALVDGYYPGFQEINGPSFKISIVMSATNLDISDYIQREADARLISAAPELLEALRASSHIKHTLPNGLPCKCSQCDFVQLRDTAIAKATQEEMK